MDGIGSIRVYMSVLLKSMVFVCWRGSWCSETSIIIIIIIIFIRTSSHWLDV